MVSVLILSGPGSSPGARFSKALETFRARKATAKSRICNYRVVYSHIVKMKKTFRGLRETGPRPGTLCCVLGQYTSLSKCLSPSRCMNGYQ